MIVLEDDQLPELASELANDFPSSLYVHSLVIKKARGKLSWPGISFVVDRLPNSTVCVARTDPAAAEKGYPPFINGYAVFIYSRDNEKLRALLDEPALIDWSQRVGFICIRKPDVSKVVYDKIGAMGGTKANSEADFYVDRAMLVGFDLTKLHLKYELPEGLRLGKLSVEHAQQLCEEKRYGYLPNNHLYFRYEIEHFPHRAIFDADGKPVAYILYRPDGCLGAGYVNPEHRGKGLFKIVCYEVLKELRDMGETHGFSDITTGNVASLKAHLAIGACVYENFECAFIEYVPKVDKLYNYK
ncbi:hypothetical protein RvY_09839 [Ramazzottius varieornatus]|uniref:Glycine N-acyltransferase-like protein n=1 Tax=Ramazzottius varieornatus TaxID=947166 RepID=A0A1D1VCV5_RAMVA|nr:hypothetical protein RvY_09839 [Ramazzottius varieornatus]